MHHLLELPDDLVKVLDEMRRVLRPGGRAVVVEPWATPFLHFVHWVSEMTLAQKLYPKLEAFATMVRFEKETYFNWLSRGDEILELLDRRFTVDRRSISWGKLMMVGVKREDS